MLSPTHHLTAASSAPRIETQRDPIRDELERERCFRVDQLGDLAADAAEAVANGDEGRLQVTRTLAMAAETVLTDIAAALRRLDNGSYGMCERCSEPIPRGRLEILPTSRLCTPCQSRADSRRGRSYGRDWAV